jgi:hypothetical protein
MTRVSSECFGFIILLAVMTLMVLLVVGTLPGGVEAETSYITGDWTVSNETVRIVDSTVDVAGNITIADRGRLVLENATLVANSTKSGEGVYVEAGGTLEVSNSTIEGNWRLTAFSILGNTTIVDSVIRTSSMVFHDGHSKVSGSVLSANLVIRSDVHIDDTSFMNLFVDYNVPAVRRNITCHISNCTIYGTGQVSSYSVPGYTTRITIDNCTFGTNDYGFIITLDQGLDLTLNGCTFTHNRVAISIGQIQGGAIRLENNILSGPGKESGSTGIRLFMKDRPVIEMTGNNVSNFRYGFLLVAREGPKCAASFGNLSARDCQWAVYAYSDYEPNADFHLTIHNSTFSDIDTCFIADDGARISVFDTKPIPGSGSVAGGGKWIRGYTTLAVGSVHWDGGSGISRGTLDLLDADASKVVSFDIERLTSKTILGWEVTRQSEKKLRDLRPSITIDSTEFTGEDIDVWGPMPVTVYLIDHVIPEIETTSPHHGSVHNKDHIAVEGDYYEAGSGLTNISYLLVGGSPVDIYAFHECKWTLLLSGLAEGRHDLMVWATDGVGNVADKVIITFYIDTVLPTIELEEVPGGVNNSTLWVRGWTEPMAIIEVKGHLVSADGLGNFELEVHLEEGLNIIVILVRDVAGNENSTNRQLVLDTEAPYLTVTSPSTGTWTNQRTVLVEGWTEPEVLLKVNGDPVELDGITFQREVDLTEGEFHIQVVVTDPGVNMVTVNLVIYVDWVEPSLAIEQPEGSLVYTRETTIQLLGFAEDSALEEVTINGEALFTMEGSFLRRLDLMEGTSEFDIMACDIAGNRNSTHITIVRDNTPPSIDVRLVPLDGELVDTGKGLYCTGPILLVEIVAFEEFYINLHGREIGPVLNTTVEFDLSEGSNEIVLVVRDLAGNEGDPFEVMVILDTMIPPLTVLAPRSGSKTTDERITIRGQTEPGIYLSINDDRFPILSNGDFRGELSLEPGPNEFHIIVADHAGHYNETTIIVTKEEPDDDLRVAFTSPWMLVVIGLSVAAVVGWVMSRSRGSRKDGDM